MKGRGMLDGAAIKRLRKARGMSLADLAKAVGVSRGFIYLLERNETGISLENAQRMAKALEIDIAALSQGIGPGQVESMPSWLAYLVSRYGLSDGDRDLLVKFVRDAGLGDEQEDETDEAFKNRWDAFYKTVCAFLPNPVLRYFSDTEVRQLLGAMGMDGVGSWRELRPLFVERMMRRVVSSECADGACWRRHVERTLGIETLRIDDAGDVAAVFAGRPDIAEPSIIGGAALVTSSNWMLGAIYRHSSGKYVLVEDCRGEKAKQRDFAFWHEATRVLVDPELKLGRGVKRVPDGLERTPIERLLCRLAVWFAFGFCGEKLVGVVSRNGSSSIMDAAAALRDEIYPQATLRMMVGAMMDAQDTPMLYVDCYSRLKHAERVAKGIRVEEVEKMRVDPDAKLRIAHVFANVAAEGSGLELRSGMRIGERSPIREAFAARTAVVGVEDLADWDYDLVGSVRTDAAYGADGHVRALVMICATGECEQIVSKPKEDENGQGNCD